MTGRVQGGIEWLHDCEERARAAAEAGAAGVGTDGPAEAGPAEAVAAVEGGA